MYISERVLFKGLKKDTRQSDDVKRYLIGSAAAASVIAGLLLVNAF